MTADAEFYIKGRRLLRKPYHLRGVGLPNVYLLNGVTLEDDPDYGTLVSIEDIPGLYRAIGLHIVTKPAAMTGPELRFLRKELKLTQEALAHRLRVNVQTVANYEKGKTAMGAAETAVRALYAFHLLPPEAGASAVRSLAGAIVDACQEFRLTEQTQRQISGAWREADKGRAAA